MKYLTWKMKTDSSATGGTKWLRAFRGQGRPAGAATLVSMAGCAMGALVAAMAVARSPAAELPPHTPSKDLKGDWSMKAKDGLPNVLLLGDSISIGYTRPVRKLLEGRANVFRATRPGGKRIDNCGDTTMGLKNVDAWLGSGHWDVIHFNWGLWDLCYRNPESKVQGNRDKVHGKLSVPLEEYERNLERLVTRLEATGARLIWASTTVVPPGEAGRFENDEVKYNAVAARVMKKHHIPTDDLHALTKSFGGRFATAPGNVHFTAAGYEKIARQVADRIGAALEQAK